MRGNWTGKQKAFRVSSQMTSAEWTEDRGRYGIDAEGGGGGGIRNLNEQHELQCRRQFASFLRVAIHVTLRSSGHLHSSYRIAV